MLRPQNCGTSAWFIRRRSHVRGLYKMDHFNVFPPAPPKRRSAGRALQMMTWALRLLTENRFASVGAEKKISFTPTPITGPPTFATPPNANCRTRFRAYRRQQLAIIERRPRYVAILLASLRGKWARRLTRALPTGPFLRGWHGAGRLLYLSGRISLPSLLG